MKQIYRKGLFVRTDLKPFEIVCVSCSCDFVFTMEELKYRNTRAKGELEILGLVSCPKCGWKNSVRKQDKFKPKGD